MVFLIELSSWSIVPRARHWRVQAIMVAHDPGLAGFRPLVVPPEGWEVEWQVKLDSADGETVTWGAYSAQYQAAIETAWMQGHLGLDYQPGRTQQYRLDFGSMRQIRTTAAPGYGSARTIRRTFVPNKPRTDPSPPADADMPDATETARADTVSTGDAAGTS